MRFVGVYIPEDQCQGLRAKDQCETWRGKDRGGTETRYDNSTNINPGCSGHDNLAGQRDPEGHEDAEPEDQAVE